MIVLVVTPLTTIVVCTHGCEYLPHMQATIMGMRPTAALRFIQGMMTFHWYRYCILSVPDPFIMIVKGVGLQTSLVALGPANIMLYKR